LAERNFSVSGKRVGALWKHKNISVVPIYPVYN